MCSLLTHLNRKLGLVGTISTCYKNNGGSLRVIDAATDSCASSETALNINQNTANNQTAYFRIKNGAIDTAALRNITSYQMM